MALLETLVDPLDGTSLNAVLWRAYAGGGVLPTISDGAAHLLPVSAPAQTDILVDSVTTYDFDGSHIDFRRTVVTPETSGASAAFVYLAQLSGGTLATFSAVLSVADDGTGLGYMNYVGGLTPASVTFDPDHTWFRIALASGVLTYSSSADGTTWTPMVNGTSSGTLAANVDDPVHVIWGGGLSGDSNAAYRFEGFGPPAEGDTTEVTAEASAQWNTQGPPVALATARWNVAPPPSVTWTGDTVAEVTVEAYPGTFAVASGFWPAAATARITVVANAGTFELGAGPPVWEAETAGISVEAWGGVFLVGSLVYGDDFYAPVLLSGLSGVASANLSAATLQTGEPYTHGTDRSWWFRYNAAGPGVLTISSLDATAHWIDVYETGGSTSIDDLQLLGSAERASTAVNLAIPVSSGAYYVRVTSSVADADIAITYNATVEAGELIAEISGDSALVQAPSSVTIGVLNAAPGETVRFEFSPPPSEWQPSGTTRPIELAEIAADASGVISGAVIDVPEVQAGSHAITVRGLTSGRIDTVVVTVQADPTPDDEEIETPEEPDFVVGYWALHDYAPGGLGTFTFPINPSSMSSPHAPRNITTEHTVAADGQPILWEGGLTAHQWQFAGYLDSQAHYDALVAFYQTNRRFQLQDHRGRRWIVGITGLDIKPRRNSAKPWAHEYTVQAHIYGQVVS